MCKLYYHVKYDNKTLLYSKIITFSNRFAKNARKVGITVKPCGIRAFVELDCPRQLGAIFEFEGQVVVAVHGDRLHHGIPQALIELRKQAVIPIKSANELNQFFTFGPAFKMLIVELGQSLFSSFVPGGQFIVAPLVVRLVEGGVSVFIHALADEFEHNLAFIL